MALTKNSICDFGWKARDRWRRALIRRDTLTRQLFPYPKHKKAMN